MTSSRVADRAGWSRWLDVAAVVLAVVISVVSVTSSLDLEQRQVDTDEAVYLATLVSMRSGQGYYDATRDALVAKEAAPPSQLRAVRPPTMFVLLRPFPPESWRWVAGAACLTTMLLAWQLTRGVSALAGPIAVLLAGIYLHAAMPYLFLHSELWGLPFALGFLVALRRRRWATAAACIVAAMLMRELYVVFLVGALIWLPGRRRPFVIGGAIVAVVIGAHAVFTSRILDPAGRETPYVVDLTVEEALSRLGPGGGTASGLLGLAVVVLGGVVLVGMARGDDSAEARTVLTAVVPLALATITVGRTYWTLTFLPVLACYAALAVRWLPVGSAWDDPPPEVVSSPTGTS